MTNITTMFFNSKVTSFNLNSLNTNNVTNMSAMFRGCTSLKELDLSNFNTDKATTMWDMFFYSSKLENIDISNFNTSNVTDWSWMFYYVPTTIEIKTNQNTANWIKEKFPTYTNIIIVE